MFWIQGKSMDEKLNCNNLSNPFVHVSYHQFDRDKIKDLTPGKPKPMSGGFWGSLPNPATRGSSVSYWDDWTAKENCFTTGYDATVVTFGLTPDARVLCITDESDLHRLEELYPDPNLFEKSPEWRDRSWRMREINWEAIQNEFDAIAVDTRDKGWDDVINVWDVPFSIVVCNPDVICDVKEYNKGEYLDMMFEMYGDMDVGDDDDFDGHEW